MLPPFAHQREAFELSKAAPAFALFMEQRTGKSRVVLDTVAYLANTGLVDALLIVAPNGVHRNWVTDEIPKWFELAHDAVIWRSGKASQKLFNANLDALLETSKIAVLALNVEAIKLEACKKYLARFLKQRKCLAVIDESQTIKSTKAARTKVALRIGQFAPFRRILSGTPNTESPFDLYTQFQFLDGRGSRPRIPGILGFTSLWAFKARYADFEIGKTRDAQGELQEFKTVKEYKNLDELNRKIAPITYRKRRAECADLPPTMYQKIYFPLDKETRALYDRLRKEYVIELSQGELNGRHVLTRMLRLQQIASNQLVTGASATLCAVCQGEDAACAACYGYGITYVPGQRTPVGARDARLERLKEVVQEVEGQGIIWARFSWDITAICDWLKAQGIAQVRYDGEVDEELRAENKALFQGGEATWLVGNPAAGGRGLDLSAADTLINYSHYFSLEIRLQSEDRPISLTKKRSLSVLDFIAEDTVDEKIIGALRDKRELSALVLGDPKPENWL